MSDILRHVSKKLNEQTGEITTQEIVELCSGFSSEVLKREKAEADFKIQNLANHALLAEVARLRADTRLLETAGDARVVQLEYMNRISIDKDNQLAAEKEAHEATKELVVKKNAALEKIKWLRKPGGTPTRYEYEVEVLADEALRLT